MAKKIIDSVINSEILTISISILSIGMTVVLATMGFTSIANSSRLVRLEDSMIELSNSVTDVVIIGHKINYNGKKINNLSIKMDNIELDYSQQGAKLDTLFKRLERMKEGIENKIDEISVCSE